MNTSSKYWDFFSGAAQSSISSIGIPVSLLICIGVIELFCLLLGDFTICTIATERLTLMANTFAKPRNASKAKVCLFPHPLGYRWASSAAVSEKKKKWLCNLEIQNLCNLESWEFRKSKKKSAAWISWSFVKVEKI